MHNRMEAFRIIVARERRVELGAGGNHVGHFQYLGVDHRYSLFRSAEGLGLGQVILSSVAHMVFGRRRWWW